MSSIGLADNVARHRKPSRFAFLGERNSSSTRTPRPMCSRVTTTDGRSPGSRVSALRRLPELVAQWRVAQARRLQLRGQPRNRLVARASPHSLLVR
jgi:hypothetical protein